MTRRPSPPPELPGFRYLEPVGTGGFADVFLYEQQMPRRQVAVKVLLADRISTGTAQEFADEANVMAMLSTHPAIVTIYQAGVADDGRPYLVMEYCPRPNLQLRARTEPLSVAEALRVGVQVAGAVETAHRAGVLHRDIKPANILVTAYNRPALTDFGIASTTGAVTEAEGMSIPWSPPESFADPPRSGPSTDVYALGATVYTLLSGRSPFERVGGRNSSADLIERIERDPLPPLGRPDSPDSLRLVLERAMAKNPADRYPSAVAFGRALQKVQIELAHSVTPIDIIDEHPPSEELHGDDDGLTRVREVVSIDPGGHSSTRPSATTSPKRSAPATPPGVPRFETVASAAPAAGPAAEQTLRRRADGDPEPDVPQQGTASADGVAPADASEGAPSSQDPTILRAPRVVSAEPAAADDLPVAADEPLSGAGSSDSAAASERVPARRPVVGIVLAAVAAVLVLGGIVAVNLSGIGRADPIAERTATSDPVDVAREIVPQVAALEGVREGEKVTFTWKNPDPEPGDLYLWKLADPEAKPTPTERTTVTVTAPGRVCIEVTLRRGDGRTAGEAQTGCVR